MDLLEGSVISLTPAHPGWTVDLSITLDGETTRHNGLPIIGWAVVVDHVYSDGQTGTDVQPAFLLRSRVMTWGDVLGELGEPSITIHPPQEQPK